MRSADPANRLRQPSAARWNVILYEGVFSRLTSVMLLCCSLCQIAQADERPVEEARQLFKSGSQAFAQHDFQRAYEAFEKAYLLSQRPELLFNMASALQGLNRPHDAADELRAYLRTVPAAVDRVEIEQRILTLEETQRILDRNRAPTAKPKTPAPIVVAPEPAIAIVATHPADAPRPRRRGLAIGLGIAGVVVVGALAVGLGVGLSSGATPAPTTSSFPPIRATQ